MFDIDKIIQNLYNFTLPSNKNIIEMIRLCRIILFKETNLIEYTGKIIVVGDIHGQFFDLLNIFKLYGAIETQNYLFLGDYVDRGYNSLETILLLIAFKIKYQNKIYLLRGNHECEQLTSIYGFKEECESKTNLIIYLELCELFKYFPIAALINDNFFCVHGGLIPEIKSIKNINLYNRYEYTVLEEMFWSDPHDKNEFIKNPRGAGYLFGAKQVNDFIKNNNIKMIIRSHQLVMEGYNLKFDNKLCTIWSAPNYCYKSDNVACVMIINEDCSFEFLIFDKCNEQKRNKDFGKYLI